MGLVLIGHHTVVLVGEDPTAYGHWCTFTDVYTDLYHALPYHTKAHSSGCPVGAGAVIPYVLSCKKLQSTIEANVQHMPHAFN